jgi:hypothetical protein
MLGTWHSASLFRMVRLCGWNGRCHELLTFNVQAADISALYNEHCTATSFADAAPGAVEYAKVRNCCCACPHSTKHVLGSVGSFVLLRKDNFPKVRAGGKSLRRNY